MSLDTSTTAKLTRQACERCRKQKLRCIRSDSADLCNRCLRKGAPCEYSSSLPKGRRRSTHTGAAAGTDRESQAGTSDECFTSYLGDTGSRSPGMDWDGLQVDLAAETSTMTTESAFDWLYGVNSAMCDNVVTASTPYPGASQNRASRQVNDAGIGFNNGGGGGTDDTEVLVAQLAQLSTHISSLRRSSCSLVEGSASSSSSARLQPDNHSEARQPPLIDDAFFQSVATWFAHGPADISPSRSLVTAPGFWAQAPEIKTLGDLLYHIFSASHYLLELLRHVPSASDPNTAATASRTELAPDLVEFALPPLHVDSSARPLGSKSGLDPETVSPPSGPSASSNNVIRHLLMANYTMLLGIYLEVLGLLQRCAGPCMQTDVTAPLRDIRLVSVVQLCSYLIDCQHQAVGSYLSSPASSLLQPDMVSDAMATKTMESMREEARQRIQCLQQIF
ncbi:hypothetical protein M406DRAFT_335100 [Cryphonectria parasitica EP155]|uniref:Zn(2)-C6 fungal-type domain-containing protein n=1 Tax=Cryphonectria parasitica (strain ATCC 38755 / EP155) TaxID=660469 RepID=A0A9P4XRE8_CRYP1|nr:uncharacterized protein M406DRAFT_335100 [Cryphonectria parasitica EP155]KAF3759884.1 hypothetical protein M406DRAFT_335100 [Cryphonectria parasitica EP155]